MISKGDYFIQTLGDKLANGYNDSSYYGIVFECTGIDESYVYSKIVGYTSSHSYKSDFNAIGKEVTFNLNTGCVLSKASHDTLEIAGLVEKKEETLDLSSVYDQLMDALIREKDNNYWAFIGEYLQMLRREAVSNKKWFVVLAAYIESEAKVLGKVDKSLSDSATAFLDTMADIEIVQKRKK